MTQTWIEIAVALGLVTTQVMLYVWARRTEDRLYEIELELIRMRLNMEKH